MTVMKIPMKKRKVRIKKMIVVKSIVTLSLHDDFLKNFH